MRLAFAVLVVLAICLPVAAQDAFVPGCPLPSPLDEIKQHRRIDSQCGPEGTGETAGKRAQNVVKNNLCATGAPTTLTRDHFKALQQKTRALKSGGQITYGGDNVPLDRSKLRNLLMVGGVAVGEGAVVRYVSRVAEARHSNVDTGESCNCHKKGAAANDIHLDLVRSLTGETLCQRVSAEMIPHLRPSSWHRVAGTGSRRRRVQPFESTPVRITGQLFFDGSHTPCAEPSGPDDRFQQRISNWEIHPVYSIDICAFGTFAACSADDESVWTPLHEEDPD